MRRVTPLGLLWRLTFIQAAIVLVAGLAAGAGPSAVIAVAFLVTNLAVMALVELRDDRPLR